MFSSMIKIENNALKILDEEQSKKEMILEAIGIKAVDTWRKIIKAKGVIDTSRFINSTTHKVVTSEDRVYIGSPINDPPYPIYLEIGTYKMAARPTLKPALLDYTGIYKDLAEQIFKQ